MPAPNDAAVFGNALHLLVSEGGTLRLSDQLVDLFVEAREAYAWPRTQTAESSQRKIVDLEQQVHILTTNLNGDNAQMIVQAVSMWGGNNTKARQAISWASYAQKQEFARLISELLTSSPTESALQGLADQPGVDLVMATKTYRFCAPGVGASVDRHCSYFFNSLWDRRVPDEPRACTQFRREWTNGNHKATRLATFSKAGREWNVHQYVDCYLAILALMADSLNTLVGGYQCAASHDRKTWRPADVEMAAYQWWSRNGPR